MGEETPAVRIAQAKGLRRFGADIEAGGIGGDRSREQPGADEQRVVGPERIDLGCTAGCTQQARQVIHVQAAASQEVADELGRGRLTGRMAAGQVNGQDRRHAMP